MSNDGVDVGKRRFLTGATSVVGAVGAGFVAVPFLSSWQPSERAKALGAPIKADISEVAEGALVIFEWRGKPVWVIRRSAEMLENLPTVDGELRDPESIQEQQPSYAKNAMRSIRPDVMVMVGSCTHLGCAPLFRPDFPAEDLGADWKGGFFCPCHGSKFDLAGRVYKGVPAPTNLLVPPYRFENDNLIVIGEDPTEEGVA